MAAATAKYSHDIPALENLPFEIRPAPSILAGTRLNAENVIMAESQTNFGRLLHLLGKANEQDIVLTEARFKDIQQEHERWGKTQQDGDDDNDKVASCSRPPPSNKDDQMEQIQMEMLQMRKEMEHLKYQMAQMKNEVNELQKRISKHDYCLEMCRRGMSGWM
jgi:chromosome segregation ATPase